MKLKLTRKLKQLGSALLTTLVICTILSMFVMYNLALVDQQGKLSARSQAWNMAMAVTEAGLEDGIEQLNSNTSNLVNDGYVKIASSPCADPYGGVYSRTNTLPDGNWYVVSIYLTNCPIWLNRNLNYPVVVAKSYVQLPAMAQNNSSTMFAAMGFGGGSGPVLSRAVQVVCHKPNFYGQCLAVRHWINLNGNNTLTDSYNSQMPGIESDTNGQYNASIYKGSLGNVACNGGLLSDSVSIGNADIYGHVSVGPSVPVTLGPSGGIGSYAWRAAGNNGIESGWLTRDSNFSFPDTSPPAGASMWNGLPGGDYVVALSIASGGTNTPTYPGSLASGLSTNYQTLPTTTGTYPAAGTYTGTVNVNNMGNGSHTYTYNLIIGIASYSWTWFSTNYLTTNYYAHVLTDNGQYQAPGPAGMTVGTNYIMGTNVSVYLPAGMAGTEQIAYALRGAYLVGPTLTSLSFVNLQFIPSMTIYCGGTSVSVSGNNIANPQGYPLNFILFCAPSVTTFNCTGNGTYVGIIVAPNADMTLKGGGSGNEDFSGAILANTALVDGHFNFHWDESLGSADVGRYLAISWLEVKP
jgi:hypothetical protein